MSKYTVELRWVVEQGLKDLGKDNVEANWPGVYKTIGLDDYPIFDDAYRSTLNDKIIRRYYFREIGAETVGLFRAYMRRTMHEIMPYYNQLYESLPLVTEPILSKNMDYTESWKRDETTDRSGTVDATADVTTETDSRNVFQDTPMNGLDTGAVASMDYATNVTFDNSDTTTHTATHNAHQDDYTGGVEGTKTHNERGYDVSQSELLLMYRKTFLNVDMEIVDRLDNLFMQIW